MSEGSLCVHEKHLGGYCFSMPWRLPLSNTRAPSQLKAVLLCRMKTKNWDAAGEQDFAGTLRKVSRQ